MRKLAVFLFAAAMAAGLGALPAAAAGAASGADRPAALDVFETEILDLDVFEDEILPISDAQAEEILPTQ